MKTGRDKKFRPGNGHLGEYDIALYSDSLVDGKLGNLPESILDHVESCSQCRDAILDVSIYMKNMKGDFTQASTPLPQILTTALNETNRRSRWILRTAASFIIVAMLSILYVSVFKPEGKKPVGTDIIKPAATQETDIQAVEPIAQAGAGEQTSRQPDSHNQPDSIASEAPQDAPDTYAINPNLEYMINNQSRHSGVLVHTPENNSKLNGVIQFSWTVNSNRKIHLKILNNRNEVLYSYSPAGEQFFLADSLQPGLYYWKLEDQTDLLHVGKFLIVEGAISPPK